MTVTAASERRPRLPWFVTFLAKRLAWALVTLFIFLTAVFFFCLLALAHWIGVWIVVGYAVYAAIVFAPVGEVVPPALRSLRKGGTVALAGIYMTPVPALDYEECLFHEKSLRSVEANTRADGEPLLTLFKMKVAIANTPPAKLRCSSALSPRNNETDPVRAGLTISSTPDSGDRG